jgi:hypothetical protein
MKALSELRRGRRLGSQAKRARLRRTQPRFAGKKLRSMFRAAPVKPRPTQPYLGSGANIADLLS